MVFVVALQVAVCVGVPLTRSPYLCEYQGIKFGVFGLCIEDQCLTEPWGYWAIKQNAAFELPSNARVSISYLLIVHPIAAGFSFLQLATTLFLLTKSMFTASWMLTVANIQAIPTFMLSLLTFLVDLILFSPHLSWFGWMQMVCTILIATTGSFMCILKRTVTSREEMIKPDNVIYLENWECDDDDENDTLYSVQNSQFTDLASSFVSDYELGSVVHRTGSRDLLSRLDMFDYEEV